MFVGRLRHVDSCEIDIRSGASWGGAGNPALRAGYTGGSCFSEFFSHQGPGLIEALQAEVSCPNAMATAASSTSTASAVSRFVPASAPRRPRCSRRRPTRSMHDGVVADLPVGAYADGAIRRRVPHGSRAVHAVPSCSTA